MWEGETLGLVGETGCGKSVTATSILRLIPQPPGRIEEGEALFDVPPEAVARIEELEKWVYALLPKLFGDTPEGHPDDLSAGRLQDLMDDARKLPKAARADLEAFLAAASDLKALKEPYDLLLKSDEEMRKIRGSQIAMIFQDPMQALNPVFPVGDQIAENILLHDRDLVVRSLVAKMEIEEERDNIGRALNEADPGGQAALRPLPSARPLGALTSLFTFVWTAVAAASLALFAVLGLVGGPFGVPLGLPAAVLALFASFTLVATYGLLGLRPWARPLGLGIAILDLIARAPGLLLGYPDWFKVFLLAGFAADVAALLFFTKPNVAESLRGRPHGWDAFLRIAEADLGGLSDVSDLVARSPLPEGVRESLQARLDALVARVRETMDAKEPITGHFHPMVPRRIQTVIFRRMQSNPRDVPLAILRRIPLLKRVVVRPVNDEAVRRAVQILRKVKIADPERIANQYPYELSGGMQQRALIAIALSCNPRLLVADEPTTALDVTIQAQILDLLRDLKKTFGSSILIITHDLGIIAEMCNRVCVMYAGHIVEDASIRAVFKAPLHPYTQGLMKAVPTHTVRKELLEIIKGSVPNLIYPPPGCRFHPRCPAVMPTCGWSAAEVGERLADVLREIAAEKPLAVNVEEIQWDGEDPTELHVFFPEGVDGDAALAMLREASERGMSHPARGPAIGAITAIHAPKEPRKGKAGHRHLASVRVLKQHRPPSFVPEPDHAVACLLYEPEPSALAGGARVGG